MEMRQRRWLWATVIAATMCIAPLAAAQRETETVERTVELPANGTLELHNFSGDVRITAGTGRDVVIKAVRRARRAQLDGIKLDISTSGSTVRIDANKRDADWDDRDNNVVETTFEIQVPASTRLEVTAFSSDVTITGVRGDQELKTFSGRIDVRGLGGAPFQAETFSGDIDVRLTGDVGGSITFNTFSGSLDSDVPLTLRSSGRRSTRADLPGGSGETMRFKTFSGDVKIGR